MTTVNILGELYNIMSPTDGDMVYVQGFWNKDDGGGGFFIFDATATIDPVYNKVTSPQTFEEMLNIGYYANYDGMVCKANNLTDGRWIRQWDRGKLNLQWFGGRPGDIGDTSKALNAALKYAQFDPLSNGTIFNDVHLTRPGKTIFIPAGRYYFRSFISTITYGVVIQGEGNMGTSAHGTRLLIAHRYNDFNFLLDENDPNSWILPFGNENGAFFRYYANGTNNSGGGLKDLTINVPLLSMTTEQQNDPNFVNAYDSNIISLMSTAVTPLEGESDCPPVSKWKAENLTFVLNNRAKRAMLLKSNQVGGSLRWRIRDTMVINCWFAGASVNGETIRAVQSSGLQITGGLFSSGLGSVNPTDPNLPPDRVLPGIFLDDCANVNLNGLDLSHGVIFIYIKSRFINIDCRFGKLLIYNAAGKEHTALHVSKRYVLNERADTTYDDLLCPFHSDNNNTLNPTGYKCYNNAQEIEDDHDTDWMHVEEPPIT
jgi:hypothetical protein